MASCHLLSWERGCLQGCDFPYLPLAPLDFVAHPTCSCLVSMASAAAGVPFHKALLMAATLSQAGIPLCRAGCCGKGPCYHHDPINVGSLGSENLFSKALSYPPSVKISCRCPGCKNKVFGAAPGEGSPTELCLCIPVLFSSSAFSLQPGQLASSSPYSPFLPIYILQHLNFPSEMQKEPAVQPCV